MAISFFVVMATSIHREPFQQMLSCFTFLCQKWQLEDMRYKYCLLFMFCVLSYLTVASIYSFLSCFHSNERESISLCFVTGYYGFMSPFYIDSIKHLQIECTECKDRKC